MNPAGGSSASLRDFRRPRLWLRLWIAALVATVVVCLVPLPRIPIPLQVDHIDKIEHAIGYALLGAYAAMLFATRRALVLAALGLLALGIGIEGLQSLVPWRSSDSWDAGANALGVLFGALVAVTPAARWLQRFDHAWHGPVRTEVAALARAPRYRARRSGRRPARRARRG